MENKKSKVKKGGDDKSGVAKLQEQVDKVRYSVDEYFEWLLKSFKIRNCWSFSLVKLILTLLIR